MSDREFIEMVTKILSRLEKKWTFRERSSTKKYKM